MGVIFKSLTRGREIGANSYLLRKGRQQVILDAGAHPKQKGLDATPNFSAVNSNSVGAIILTHAHHDHIGALPVLQRMQSNAPVYMTEVTGEVGAGMLHNSVNVMTHQREELGIMEYPLFTHKELDQAKTRWSYRDLKRPFTMPNLDFECTFYDAGHIIGSAGVLVRDGENTLFYTGDVNFEDQTVSCAADFPTEGIDVLVMETTRGANPRPADFSRRAEKERLAKFINETFEAEGAVMIPVFALGKSQELLMMLHELQQMELIPKVPVLIGGLSAKMTQIYDQYASKSRRHYQGFQILQDMDMLIAPRRRKKELTCQPQSIYALSSGMMSEGTVSNQFARHFIDNPKNALAFVGYTDSETPGYRIRQASTGDMIVLDEKLPKVELKCAVECFDFSAHSDRQHLLDYAIKVNPKKIILVHGDIAAQEWFMEQLKAALPQTEVISCEAGQEVELWD